MMASLYYYDDIKPVVFGANQVSNSTATKKNGNGNGNGGTAGGRNVGGSNTTTNSQSGGGYYYDPTAGTIPAHHDHTWAYYQDGDGRVPQHQQLAIHTMPNVKVIPRRSSRHRNNKKQTRKKKRRNSHDDDDDDGDGDDDSSLSDASSFDVLVDDCSDWEEDDDRPSSTLYFTVDRRTGEKNHYDRRALSSSKKKKKYRHDDTTATTKSRSTSTKQGAARGRRKKTKRSSSRGAAVDHTGQIKIKTSTLALRHGVNEHSFSNDTNNNKKKKRRKIRKKKQQRSAIVDDDDYSETSSRTSDSSNNYKNQNKKKKTKRKNKNQKQKMTGDEDFEQAEEGRRGRSKEIRVNHDSAGGRYEASMDLDNIFQGGSDSDGDSDSDSHDDSRGEDNEDYSYNSAYEEDEEEELNDVSKPLPRPPPRRQSSGFFGWLFRKEQKELERGNLDAFSTSFDHSINKTVLSSIPESDAAHYGADRVQAKELVAAQQLQESLQKSFADGDMILDEEEANDYGNHPGDSSDDDVIDMDHAAPSSKASMASSRSSASGGFWETIRKGMKDYENDDGVVAPPAGFWDRDGKRKHQADEQEAARRRRCRLLICLFFVVLLIGGIVAATIILLDKNKTDGSTSNVALNNSTEVLGSTISDESGEQQAASGGQENDENDGEMVILNPPTPAPTTPMPVTSAPTGLYICNLCGADGSTDKTPQNLGALISRPLVGSTNCGTLVEMAQNGQITEAECLDWQLYVPSVCFCS